MTLSTQFSRNACVDGRILQKKKRQEEKCESEKNERRERKSGWSREVMGRGECGLRGPHGVVKSIRPEASSSVCQRYLRWCGEDEIKPGGV